MRWTATFFFLLFVLCVLGWALVTTPEIVERWPALEADWVLPTLRVGMASSGMMWALWGILVLAWGGPRKFYAEERAWRRDTDGAFPPVVPAVAVRTDVVLESYRPRLGEYGRFARRTAAVVLPGGVLVLVYAATMITINDRWDSAAALLVLAIVLPTVVGLGWVALILLRSRVEIHPDGATVVGAWRRVVLGNSSNTVIATEGARTGLTDLGSLYIDRASGRRCAVWATIFEEPPGGLDHRIRRVAPRAIVRQRPSTDLARFVSLGDRRPWLPLAAIVYAIVLLASLGVAGGIA